MLDLLALAVLPSPSLAGDAPAISSDHEVVVEESARDGTDPMSIPSSVTVIEVDARLPAASDVAAVVDSASGTTVQRLGGLGDWSAVSIRGSTMRQVQVHLDGIPLNPDGATTVNLAELPLEAFRRIEVYRGNAPPELDAAPIGGVVNLVTGDAGPTTAAAATGSHHTGRLFASGGRTADLGLFESDLLLCAEAFSTRGDFAYFDDNATDYNLIDDALRPRENNDKTQFSAHARWRAGSPRVRLTLLDAFLTREEGVPGTGVAPAESTRLDTRRNLAAAQLEGEGDAGRAFVRGWWHRRAETWDDREGELGVGTQWNEDRFDTAGVLTHGRWAASPSLAPALTLGFRSDRVVRLDLLAEEEDDPRRRTSLTATPAVDAWAWDDRLAASVAASLQRLDHRALGEIPYEDFPATAIEQEPTVTAVSPRAGLLLRPRPLLALKANAGRYLRPPDLTELYGDRGSIIGNPGLRPETGWQADVGGRAVLPDSTRARGGPRPPSRSPPAGGSFEVSYFWRSTHDMVAYVQNSQSTMVPVNLDRAWVQGVEAAATLDVLGILESQTNLTRNVSVNLSTRSAYANNQLPGIPTWEVYQRTALHRGDRWRIGHTFSFTDGNYWDETNWFRASPRPVHGLFARFRPGPRAPEASVDVLNVADTITQVAPANPLDPSDDNRVVEPITDFVGYPLPGRTVIVTVRWTG